MDLGLLCFFAFLAGFVDAVVGGGGLIQLPALLVFLPRNLSSSIPLVFGTNKFSSFWGTGTAVVQYARSVQVPWRTIIPAAVIAFATAVLGVKCVQVVRGDLLKPLILVLLVLVAWYTYSRKELGGIHAPRFVARHELLAGLGVGAVLGFYDGFFGPGTGSFLIFIFIALFQFDFLTASASAKVINFSTNLASIVAFGVAGQILWRYAVPMAFCNVMGAVIGARLTIAKGNRFVRGFFLFVVAAMIARFGWDLAFGR